MAAGGDAAAAGVGMLDGRMLGEDITPGRAIGMGTCGLNPATRIPKRVRATWLPA